MSYGWSSRGRLLPARMVYDDNWNIPMYEIKKLERPELRQHGWLQRSPGIAESRVDYHRWMMRTFPGTWEQFPRGRRPKRANIKKRQRRRSF